MSTYSDHCKEEADRLIKIMEENREFHPTTWSMTAPTVIGIREAAKEGRVKICLLYTSDAADE